MEIDLQIHVHNNGRSYIYLKKKNAQSANKEICGYPWMPMVQMTYILLAQPQKKENEDV